MNNNKKIFGLIILAVFLTIVVSISPISKLAKRVLNDLNESNNNHTYLTASFKYLDKDGKEVKDIDDKIYVFLTKGDNGQDGMVTLALTANGEKVSVTKIYDQNGSEIKENNTNGHEIDGTYSVTVAVLKDNQNNNDFKESSKFDENKYYKYNDGDSYNGSYTITYNETVSINSNSTEELEIKVKERDGKRLSSSEILEPMNLATNFGVFALKFSQYADIEATVGVQTFERNGSQTFGLSDHNYEGLNKVNEKTKIVVDKNYEKNNNPLSGKEVKIVLLKDNENIKEQTCKTDNEGKCSVIFKDVEKGTYTVAESINGEIVSTDETVVDESGNSITVKFNNNNIELKEFNDSDKIGYNYNYIEKIGSNEGEVHLEKIRKPGTLVLGTRELVTKYEKNQEFQNKDDKERVTVVLAGTEGYPTIDFDKEFDKLKNLSVQLATAIDSEDVKVYYKTVEEIKNTDIDFKSYEKEYILVNVDCGNSSEVIIGGRNKIDGKNPNDTSFVYDEGAKIIYNFYTKNGNEITPYTHSIKTSDSTAGIILAPAADVEGAKGNHSGTIIAKDYNHKEGEVHQKVIPKWLSSSNNASITNTIVEKEKENQDVRIGKVDETGKNISGAELQLTDDTGKEIENWVTDNNLHKVNSELEKGKEYIIKEIKAPEGYQLARDYTFTYNGQETQEYTMIDTKVIVKKTDEEKKYLPGATLQILDLKGNIIETWTSGDTEHIVTSKLNPGEKYVLHEENAPLGYKKAKDVQFVFEAGEKNKIIELENQKIVIGVFVEKLDWNKKELSGAQLQILDSENNIIDSWTSDGSVHRVQAKLEIGKKYRLHEKSAPEGYEISKDVEFVVKNTEDNQMVRMMDNKIIIKGEPFVKISKVDKNEKYLVGAELQLLDSNGNVIEQWMSNDQTHIVDAKLEIGKQYTLHEKSAPSGYEKAEDITFTAKEDEQEIKMVDERIRKVAGVVETLDDISKYIIIFAVSLILLFGGFIGFIIYNKKKLSK